MGLMNGVADAIQDGRSKAAESDAFSANMRAGNAERVASDSRQQVDTALQGALMWKRRVEELTKSHDIQTSKLSGCKIVINAMITTMEQDMSPSERERFRENLVNRARNRMLELDNERRGTADFLDVEKTFRTMEQNKILGIV